MRQTIENLRNKPNHVKNRISISVASVATFFIYMFWLSNQNVFSNKAGVYNASGEQNSASAFDSVKNSFISVFSSEKNYEASSSIEVLAGSKVKNYGKK